MRRFSLSDWRFSLGGIAILIVGLVLTVGVPLGAYAQEQTTIPRIGYLSPRAGPTHLDEAFRLLLTAPPIWSLVSSTGRSPWSPAQPS